MLRKAEDTQRKSKARASETDQRMLCKANDRQCKTCWEPLASVSLNRHFTCLYYAVYTISCDEWACDEWACVLVYTILKYQISVWGPCYNYSSVWGPCYNYSITNIVMNFVQTLLQCTCILASLASFQGWLQSCFFVSRYYWPGYFWPMIILCSVYEEKALVFFRLHRNGDATLNANATWNLFWRLL